MIGRMRFSRWLVMAVMLAVAECAGLLALSAVPAQAQFWNDDGGQRRQPRQRGNFFENFFGPFNARPPQQEAPPPPVDYSRAPPPPKKAQVNGGDEVKPNATIMVMGDGMADWLAFGLENAFADAPEVSIVRQVRANTGLFRYEPKGDIEWWEGAREILSKEKADYVVVMLGVSDRQTVRERDLDKEKEAEEKAAAEKKAKEEEQKGDKDKKAQNDKQPSIVAPEPKKPVSNATFEFHTDRWAEIYAKRVDKMIAAAKSKGVPVFWVGLPAVYGTKSTADMVYLNDIFRARAEKAGVVYIDVWDGFVDESGKFVTFGPDLEGQIRRLRTQDGVYFTDFGARKLAHYVEREIRRYMSNRATPVALPSGPIGPVPGGPKSTARPLAGPVVPLTVVPNNVSELAGGAGTRASHGDAIAQQVLIKGEPVNAPPGRADDFAWPQGNDNKPASDAPAAAPAPAKSSSAAPVAAPPVAAAPPLPVDKPAQEAKKPAEVKPAPERTVQVETGKPKPPVEARPRPPADIRPPPPRQPSFFSSSPFGWMR